ncbi:hypothetical protein HK405_001897, partial [Cladochytrium tenue]
GGITTGGVASVGGRKGGGAGGGGRPARAAAVAASLEVDPERSYRPFALSEGSSFHASRLTARQRARLDRATLARYGAYEAPAAAVVGQVDLSAARARAAGREERRRFAAAADEVRRALALRRGIVDEEEKSRAKEYAARAAERVREKLKAMSDARFNELQILVEGQRSSIDAIRLNEFLA